MSNKLYRPRRKRRKEKLSLIDKIEIGGITIAAVVLIGWSSWSIVDSFTPDPVIPSREVYTDGISSYIAGLTSDSDSTDAESTSATDTDSSDTDIKDADSDKKEEKDDETDSEKEKKKAETTAAADMQKAADEAEKNQAETAATPSQAAEATDTTAAAPAETTNSTNFLHCQRGFKHPPYTRRESTGRCQLPGRRNFKYNRGRLYTCRLAEGKQKRS